MRPRAQHSIHCGVTWGFERLRLWITGNGACLNVNFTVEAGAVMRYELRELADGLQLLARLAGLCRLCGLRGLARLNALARLARLVALRGRSVAGIFRFRGGV